MKASSLQVKNIQRYIYLFVGIVSVLGNSLNAQNIEAYDDDLHIIDSIVSTGYAVDALELSNKVYKAYRSSDTTSQKFKRLCTNYLFVLENLDLNEKAIELSTEIIGLNLGEEVNAHVYLTLSLIHEKSSNMELAKEYLNLSKPLVFDSSNDSLKAVWFIRSSSFYHVTDHPDSCHFFANQAYKLSKKIQNKSTIATSAFLLAMFTTNDSEKLALNKEALDMFLAVNDFRLGVSQSLSLYVFFKEKQNDKKALKYLNKAKEIAAKTPLIDSRTSLFYYLKKHYAEEGDYALAYKYADSLAFIKDLTFVRSDRINLVSADFQFKTNQLKNELNKAEQNVEIKEEENQQLIISVVGAFFITLFLFFIANDQRKKKKIATQNQYTIKKQNAELVKANEENKLLMQEMNHRLKNNLSTLSAILEIQASQESDPKITQALKKSLERVDLLSSLHKRILSLETQKSYKSDEILLEVIKGQLFLFNTQPTNVKIDVDPILLRTKSISALSLILNELLTNALKYGEKSTSPSLDISIKKVEDDIMFSISNNGSEMPKGYQISNQNSSGLYITDLLVKQLGGMLRWDSVSETTTFYFSF